MKKNEKNFIQDEKKEELNEKELDGISGGSLYERPKDIPINVVWGSLQEPSLGYRFGKNVNDKKRN